MPDPRHLDLEAAADGVPPIFPDHAPDPRHRVKGHDRTLPPKAVDPNVLPIFDPPEPKPRKVPVKPHHRRNPRRKETEQMTTITTPGRASAMAAARARATDPETSHAAAASIDVNPSQVAVLRAFQAKAVDDRSTIDFIVEAVGPPSPGFTDEALVDHLEEKGTKFSPSRLRTARRELADLGLVEESGERRPTKRGRQADVYVLTARGEAFEVES